MNNRHLTLPLAVALALASSCVSAMGLGQLQVKSGLYQPLVAEIPIISATPSELDQLDVRLASPEAFSRVGLERPVELTANLQFSVGKNASGQPVIRVTTPGRFSEPFLSFLIEADWGKGTVTREYTALIDPPYIAPAVIQPMLTPTIAAAPVPAPAPAPIAPPVAAAPVPEPEAAQTSPAKEPEPTEVAPMAAPRLIAETPVAPAQEPAPPPAPVSKPLPAPQAVAAPAPKPAPAPTPVVAPGQYGPVRPGQTLWSIANSVRPDASVSVNQMMVALLRANPDAFAQDNINRLKRGSVLRVPGQDEVTSLSAAAAAALVSQQANAWRSPRQPVPQPAESTIEQNVAATPAAPKSSSPRVSSASPARPSSRLEIVPPSGNSRARGAQSGAAVGAGGTELRAELAQAREDLAARTSEVTELKSRVADLEKQDSDRQRLIEMQNSQMKDLQDRLKQMESEQAASAAAGTAPASAPQTAPDVPQPAPTADAASPVAPAPALAASDANTEAKPWYLNPFVLVGAVLVVLGGLVLALRRSKPKLETGEPTARRLSDDEALRASIAKTREAGERIEPEPSPSPVAKAAPPADPELDALKEAVRSRPQDLEAHLSMLRLHHSRGNATDYEVAAQAMRLRVPSTMDPRWREAVILGASLMPGHALFSQAGWNSPRFSEAEMPSRAAAPPAGEPAPASIKVFDEPVEFGLEAADQEPVPRAETATNNELDLDGQASVFGDTLGKPPMDVHRNEAELMVEDEASATRIELAKAYLDIGDLDGARSMLEEVLADGGPTAQAEAGRILKEIG